MKSYQRVMTALLAILMSISAVLFTGCEKKDLIEETTSSDTLPGDSKDPEYKWFGKSEIFDLLGVILTEKNKEQLDVIGETSTKTESGIDVKVIEDLDCYVLQLEGKAGKGTFKSESYKVEGLARDVGRDEYTGEPTNTVFVDVIGCTQHGYFELEDGTRISLSASSTEEDLGLSVFTQTHRYAVTFINDNNVETVYELGSKDRWDEYVGLFMVRLAGANIDLEEVAATYQEASNNAQKVK